MQARMQRQIRRWQCETARARSRAEQLARQLAAHTGVTPEEQPRSPEDNEQQRHVQDMTIIYGLFLVLTLLVGGAAGWLLTTWHYEQVAAEHDEEEQEMAEFRICTRRG